MRHALGLKADAPRKLICWLGEWQILSLFKAAEMYGRKNLAMRPPVFHLNFLVFVISFVAPFITVPAVRTRSTIGLGVTFLKWSGLSHIKKMGGLALSYASVEFINALNVILLRSRQYWRV